MSKETKVNIPPERPSWLPPWRDFCSQFIHLVFSYDFVYRQAILVIRGFCICEFISSLEFICDPLISTSSPFKVIHSQVQRGRNLSHLTPTVLLTPSKASQLCFSPCPVKGLSFLLSGWLCFVLVILFYCRHGTEVLSTVPKCKKAVDVLFGENMCVR